jgi:arabinosaccharide transport system permease protein
MADITPAQMNLPTAADIPTATTGLFRRRVEWALIYAALIAFGVIVGAPFLYMITGSLKTNADLYSYPLNFLAPNPTLNNYNRLLSGEEIPYIQQFMNSIIVAVSQTLLALFFSSLVGWGFAKFEFFGKRFLFIFLLATLALPFQITLVPLFLMMFQIGWLDNYLAIIIPGSISAFGVFFMRQSMVTIPEELLDAARIDGASEWGIFWRIGIPLSRGALSVLAVLTYLGAWNDYLWPLIVLRSSEKFTYPVGLATLNGLYKVEYGMILAGAFIATLPVVLIFVAGRKQLLDNLTIGAVKR